MQDEKLLVLPQCKKGGKEEEEKERLIRSPLFGFLPAGQGNSGSVSGIIPQVVELSPQPLHDLTQSLHSLSLRARA